MSWRLAVATGCNIHTPIASTLDVFADAGVNAVEVGTPPRHFDLWEQASLHALDGQLRRLRLTAVSIHAPFGGPSDLSDPRPERRHAAISGALVAASTLASLSGAHVIVHTTDVPRHGEDVGMRLKHCASSLQMIGRVCRQLGVRLVVETPLPHLIGGQPDEFAWVMAQLDENAGVCIDTGHAWLGGWWDEFVRVAGGRLVHIHANDNHGERDDHLVPGDGRIEWSRIRDSLRTAGFSGWIVLELSADGIPAAPHISRALQCARNLLD